MRSGFYLKLACSNLKRNRGVYMPFVFASALMVLVYYVFGVITDNPGMANVPSSETLNLIMRIGGVVAIGFSVIFIFYANSFLIRRRKKEIVLYGVLGLEKRHVAVMMTFETALCAFAAIALGIIFGMIFAKLAFLVLMKMIHLTQSSTLVFEIEPVIDTVRLFLVTFLLTLIYNLFQVQLGSPAQLLKSENKGEKEPKGSLAMTVVGLLFILAGYVGAQIMDSAGLIFVMAAPTIICVVIGTYLLFMAGSIFVLKKLKSRRKLYYKPENFIAVSGLMYRMKQNSVGLASICILCTMVVITLSTTVSMNVGAESSAKAVSVDDVSASSMPEEEYKAVTEAAIEKYAPMYHVTVDELYFYPDKNFVGVFDDDGTVVTAWKKEYMGYSLTGDFVTFQLMSAQTYEDITGEMLELSGNEAIVIYADQVPEKMDQGAFKTDFEKYVQKGRELRFYDDGSVSSQGLEEQHLIDGSLIITDVRDNPKLTQGKYSVRQQIFLIVADDDMVSAYSNQYYDDVRYSMVLNYTGNSADRQSFIKAVKADMDATGYGSSFNSWELILDTFYIGYGGLLFIGCFLSILFLIAMVIIIYYKQMSEGYEDRERYQILMKVGIDEKDVKRTISRQVRTIFVMPLAVAAVHAAASFKMMGIFIGMVDLMGNPNYAVFGICTLVVVCIVALIYMIVYCITANVYYKYIH